MLTSRCSAKGGHRIFPSESARPSREMCTYGERSRVSACGRRDGVVFSGRLFALRGCNRPAGPRGPYRGFVLKTASVSRASAALITRFYTSEEKGCRLAADQSAPRFLKYRSALCCARCAHWTLCAPRSRSIPSQRRTAADLAKNTLP